MEAGGSQAVAEASSGCSDLVDEGELWRLWRSRDDQAARARLLHLHLPYARVIAATAYARRKHDEIEFGDYLQLASLALVEAAGRFDPARGVQFRTFASRRMLGAILDGIERLTEKQQQIAARKRLQSQRREDAKQLAQERLESVGALPAEQRALRYVAEAGLAFALAWLLEGSGLIRDAETSGTHEFYASAEMRQLRERIAELVRTLPAQERKVIHGYYFQARPFDEVAAEMGLTKGRISQIHKKALGRLREGLAAEGRLDAAF